MKNGLLFIVALFSLMSVTLSGYSQQWGLYTLYATKNGTKAYLVDTADVAATYKTWTFASNKKSAYSAYLIPGDTLVRTYTYTASGGMTGGGVTGGVQKVDWGGNTTWDFQYNSSTYTLHHDICPMPNGNVLMIAYELKTSAEATQAGATTTVSIKSEKLMEVRQTGPTTGVVVWEWHLWDHLCQNNNPAKDNYVTSIIDNPQLLNINYTPGQDKTDRWHMNGVDYNEELDQIAISMHFMNSVFVIDHSTTTAEAAGHTGGIYGKGGDFLYRWGNPASFGATGTAVFSTIHDAHWVPNDNPNYPGYLCGYNNAGGTGGKTAVDIWLPPYDGDSYTMNPGVATLPSTYAYQYNSSFSASNEGNSQQLPNGNMLVNNAFGSVYEINSAGTVLWSKATSSSHCYRFTKCQVRGPIASASSSATSVNEGNPVTLNSSAVSVTETSPTYSYAWSSGENTQNPTIYPAVSGTYIVTITNTALGCSDTASVYIEVLGTSVSETEATSAIEIYPNPSTGMIHISNMAEEDYSIIVMDIYGKTICQGDRLSEVDLSSNENGIYLIQVITGNQKTVKKIILLK
ncbi:MAG: hypothetical protein CVU05_01515 [Bacteroidetes bacterium HGW-Bacteroidetes-21]|jgi:hypothetical protein|nr:MAG: hypothetical protein CVU05_01515 [Bacteroidetes bacterium HGW-Bacteroidetes-21]